jgi:RNA polymerase sigma factor (sigma-70 family)
MTTTPLKQVMQHLRRKVLVRDCREQTDGELLQAFIARREEAAFEALVRRHGPMVMGVCRRVIGNVHDAEDAFQATFLVLARKAASVVPREAVGNWLYGVAYRTGLEARGKIARRQAREKQVTDMPHPQVSADGVWPELRPVLDQELSRLPDKYRLAIVLCDLQGQSRKDVARQLGLPEGTLSSRLATGRRMLARRLASHGLALSGGALATLLSQHAAAAGVPTPLAAATAHAAALLAAGETAAGVVAAPVAALADGVLKAMLITRLKATAVFLLVLGMIAVSGGILHRSLAGTAADQPAAREQIRAHEPRPLPGDAAEPAPRPQPRPAPARAEAPTMTGRVVAYEPNQSITLETTSRAGVKKTEFVIVKDTTRIELPTRAREIQVGMILSIWTDRSDPKRALRIGQQTAGNRPSTVRPPK